MKKQDGKYFYTAKLMNQALLNLLEKKDIEYITVTEITKKAGVNRSTFYLHYDNVYELFEETIENINNEFINSFSINSPLKLDNQTDAFFITDEFLLPYLKFCKENKRVLKLAHQKPHLFKNKKTYQKMYDAIFLPAISKFLIDENKKIYYLEFYTNGVVGIINKWLDLDCKTEIEEIIKTIKDCINYSI